MCPGSVRQSRGIIEVPSIFALEGTQAHELLERCLRARSMDQAHGHPAFEGVRVCFDHVFEILDEFPDAVLLVEVKFTLWSEAAPNEVYGTCDIAIYIPSLKRLHVIDYKHGAGEFVDVFGNMQVRFYAAGAIWFEPKWDVLEVVLTIVQPRIDWADPIRTEVVPVSDIIEFAASIDDIIRDAQSPVAPLAPSTEACKWCPGRITCPARQQITMASVGMDFADVKFIEPEAVQLPVANSLPPAEVARLLALADIASEWFKDLRAYATQLAAANTQIPGYKLVEAQAKRKWTGDVDAIAEKLAALVDDCAPPEYFIEPKLKGITEVEKYVRDYVRKEAPKGKQKENVKAVNHALALLTTKATSGNVVLVPNSDSRLPVNRTLANFGDVVAIPYIPITDESDTE